MVFQSASYSVFLLVEMTESKTNYICTLDLRLKSGNISRYLFCNLDVYLNFHQDAVNVSHTKQQPNTI